MGADIRAKPSSMLMMNQRRFHTHGEIDLRADQPVALVAAPPEAAKPGRRFIGLQAVAGERKGCCGLRWGHAPTLAVAIISMG